jgi:hypothetical protein
MAMASWAQSPEETMRGLVDRIGMLGQGTVTTVAIDRREARTTTTVVSAAFSWTQGRKPLLEALTVRDGRLIQRTVCDGDTVWDYSAQQNTYWSTRLIRGQALPPNWRNQLFQTVLARSSGATVFTVSLLADMFGQRFAEGGPWRPWHAGARVESNGLDLTYRVATPAPATVTYHLDLDHEKRLVWTGATFESNADVEPRGRFKWSAAIYPGRLPERFDPEFVPPRTARALSVERAQAD